MPELPNPKHEKVAQSIARGLSPTEAYISAGYSRKGAHASAARLLQNATICTRLAELRQAVTASVLQLAITERTERLIALQERWDALREAKAALAREDYVAAMRTGVVCRRVRWVGGKDGREVTEYEINMALIEALNSVEKRAAIETGQEQENVNLTGQISAKSIALSKVMTLPELEELERKMLAAMEEEKNPGKVVEPAKP
jgi:phage terminase small subunit